MRDYVPDSLTNATPVPRPPVPLTWGALAVWSDELIDAVDTCNADKGAIRQLTTTKKP